MLQTLTLNLDFTPETNADRVLASASRLIGTPVGHAPWVKTPGRNVLVVDYMLAGIAGGTKDLMWRLAELSFEIDRVLIRMLAVGERGAWLASVHAPGFYTADDMRARDAGRLRPGYVKSCKTCDFTLLDGSKLSATCRSALALWPAGLRRTGAVIEFDNGAPGPAFADLVPDSVGPTDRQAGRGFTYTNT